MSLAFNFKAANRRKILKGWRPFSLLVYPYIYSVSGNCNSPQPVGKGYCLPDFMSFEKVSDGHDSTRNTTWGEEIREQKNIFFLIWCSADPVAGPSVLAWGRLWPEWKTCATFRWRLIKKNFTQCMLDFLCGWSLWWCFGIWLVTRTGMVLY